MEDLLIIFVLFNDFICGSSILKKVKSFALDPASIILRIKNIVVFNPFSIAFDNGDHFFSTYSISL